MRDSRGRFRRHGAPWLAAETRERREHDAYLEAAYSAAEAATRGHLVTPAGWRRGVRPRQWFGGTARSLRFASEELRQWFAVQGRPLSLAEWRAQAFEVWGEAA